jgi:predicted DCC family thiol-disulfide oxidoreductase YuxK
MFVNYFTDDRRSSPVNLAMARLVLGGWLIWKTIWYDWSRHVNTPYRAVAAPAYEWAIPTFVPWLLTAEKWVLIACLCLFVVGYRIRITAATASLLLAHLGTVRRTLVQSGEAGNLFVGVFFLLFFALYADVDELSVDGIRRMASNPVSHVADRLVATTDRRYSMPPLKYALLVLAILYFSSGVSKIVDGEGLAFVRSETLTRLVLVRSSIYPWHDVQLLLVEYPILSSLGGAGTLALELGFLVAVLFGIAFTPFMIGLAAFVFTNAVLLGIFFPDNLFFIGLFFAYDRAYARVALDRRVSVVFDEHCSFCSKVLYPFKLLDINDTVRFVPQADAPDRYRSRGDVDFERAMYTFHEGVAYEGYDAFRELLRQFGVFFWLVWLMQRPLVERVGRRTYRYVADNRGRRFACRVEADSRDAAEE